MQSQIYSGMGSVNNAIGPLSQQQRRGFNVFRSVLLKRQRAGNEKIQPFLIHL